MATPWHRMKCQYSVHCAVKNVATTKRQLAENNGNLKYPRSNRRPVTRDGRNVNAYCIENCLLEGMIKKIIDIMPNLSRTYPCSVKSSEEIYTTYVKEFAYIFEGELDDKRSCS